MLLLLLLLGYLSTLFLQSFLTVTGCLPTAWIAASYNFSIVFAFDTGPPVA